MSQVSRKIQELFSPYNEILFINKKSLGFLVFLITFIQPNIALSGLLALLFAHGLLVVLKVDGHYLIRGSLLSNSLLVGLFVGYLFKLNFLALLFCFSCVFLTFLVTYFLNSFLLPQALPVLSLPFTLVALFIALSVPGFTNLTDGTPYFSEHFGSWFDQLPLFMGAFFRSLGEVFCIPEPLFGLSLVFFVLIHSPLTACFLILGYGIGVNVEKMFVFSGTETLLKHHAFNYSLIFASIAGTFLIPSIRSLLWSGFGCVVAVSLSAASCIFLRQFGIPVLALPFNMMAFLILRTLRTMNPAMLVSLPAGTPEKALERSGLFWLRHRVGELGVYCPLEKECLIQQGFDGDWTHRGNWRHGLDFVMQGEDGKTFRNLGVELDDYLIFGQPVVSPVEGYVVSLCASSPDNPIGTVDNQNNWGNYILIKTLGGSHICLAHLKRDSLKVSVGEYVSVGRKVALCGNSGYSREPHLHLQAQFDGDLTAYTIPFHLMNYITSKTSHFHRTPLVKEAIKPFNGNGVLDRVLTFPLGQALKWKVDHGKGLNTEVVFYHYLDETSGLPYWTDGTSRLYYSKFATEFHFYGLEGERWSPLWDFYAVVPRIPLVCDQPVEYTDFLPRFLTLSLVPRCLSLLWQLLSSRIWLEPSLYSFDPATLEIKGFTQIKSQPMRTFCKIDPMSGFNEFRIGDRKYVRSS